MKAEGRQRVLVTGANGFVGRALIERLGQDTRFETVCAVRNVQSFASTLPGRTRTIVVGDINAETNWTEALRETDCVVHLAARVHVMHETAGDPLSEFRKVNVDGTRTLALQAAAAGVRRLVYLSSIKVNGEAGVFTERDAPAPTDPYGVSKNEAEIALREIAKQTGLETVIIRPPLVYGPGVKANFRMLMDLVAKGMPLPLGAVNNRRSFVAVQNLADFIVHVITNSAAANETFLVSDGDDISTAELVRRMGMALGKPARLLPVPSGLMRTGAAMLGKKAVSERLLGSLQLDISKARRLTGWNPPVTMTDALKAIVTA